MRHFCIIDLETSGGNYKLDRITEIAIIKYDGTKIIDQYHTLINPTVDIPYFISRLTGIDNEMVANAPKFFEVAKKIVEFTDNCYFVAHNVNFDYRFMQAEFKQFEFPYIRPTLCTVSLSRRFLPNLPSYSLGKLCKSLEIELLNHHRALDDALATAKIFDMIVQNNDMETILSKPAKRKAIKKN
jgi:DNA polymerase III subunit epsilon